MLLILAFWMVLLQQVSAACYNGQVEGSIISLRNGETSECKQGIATKLSAWRNTKREDVTASDTEKNQWHFELFGDSRPLSFANHRGPWMRAGRKDEPRPWLQFGRRDINFEVFHSDKYNEPPFAMINGKRTANSKKIYSEKINELPFAIMKGKRKVNSKRLHSVEINDLPFVMMNGKRHARDNIVGPKGMSLQWASRFGKKDNSKKELKIKNSNSKRNTKPWFDIGSEGSSLQWQVNPFGKRGKRDTLPWYELEGGGLHWNRRIASKRSQRLQLPPRVPHKRGERY
eukprot:TCONS_00055959-protein